MVSVFSAKGNPSRTNDIALHGPVGSVRQEQAGVSPLSFLMVPWEGTWSREAPGRRRLQTHRRKTSVSTPRSQNSAATRLTRPTESPKTLWPEPKVSCRFLQNPNNPPILEQPPETMVRATLKATQHQRGHSEGHKAPERPHKDAVQRAWRLQRPLKRTVIST